MTRKVTISIPDELYKEAHDIIKDKTLGKVLWNHLIGLGVRAYKENPQLIDRINKVEEAMTILLPKIDEIKDLKVSIYNLTMEIGAIKQQIKKDEQ